jgi:hypothetical protein
MGRGDAWTTVHASRDDATTRDGSFSTLTARVSALGRDV